MAEERPLFRWDAIEESFSDRARLQAMLDFERALAQAEAAAGVIPPAAASAISARCSADLFDAGVIAQAEARAGNLAVPLVKQLMALVGGDDPAAARFEHFGATSQDAIDTGLVLQLRPALERIEAELERLAGILAVRVREHRATLVAGRTWMQHAVPTSFGLKVAGWLDAIDRHRQRLADVRGRALVLQLGGAVGSLTALGNRGLAVATALAEELDLPRPALAWHTHRDRLAEVATILGLCTGTLGKIARDVALHMQTEVAEVFEPAGDERGGSSTMPHKRNPVTSAVVLAAAARVPGLVASMLSAMVQEEERGRGGWHAEWEVLPELVGLVGGAIHHLAETMAGLEVDAARMRANLEATKGLVFAEAVQMALREKAGAGEARELVERSCRRSGGEGRHLREVLAADPEIGMHLSSADLAGLFDPERYLGAAHEMIDGVLAAHSGRPVKARVEGR